MCAESFGNTNDSGLSQSMPGLAFSSSRSARNVFRCDCGCWRQRLLLRAVGLHMQILWKRISALVSEAGAHIDRYLPMTLSAASRVRFAVTLCLRSHGCALSAVLSPSCKRCGRFPHLYRGKGWVTRMREQDLDTPDIARLVRGATARDWRAWERQLNHYSGLVWTSTSEGRRAARLRGAPVSAGSRCATWRSVSCLAKSVLRQGCS